MPCAKRAYRRGANPGVFEFLGFTFYGGRSRQGAVIPQGKISGKRLLSQLKKVALGAEKVCNRYPLKLLWSRFCTKMEGHSRS